MVSIQYAGQIQCTLTEGTTRKSQNGIKSRSLSPTNRQSISANGRKPDSRGTESLGRYKRIGEQWCAIRRTNITQNERSGSGKMSQGRIKFEERMKICQQKETKNVLKSLENL